MKIICAPDSFKESLSAEQAARAMARGIGAACPAAKVDLCPIADGGDGTVDAMLAATGGTEHVTTVRGPLGEPTQARWGMLGARAGEQLAAVIEMAAASGMALLSLQDRDPTRTSTYGTGQLIQAALDNGAERIIIGIGGSATNDGGCGMAQALGVRFLDTHDRPVDQPVSGGMLGAIGRIDVMDLDRRVGKTRIVVACDVTNPMTGPDGAAHIYGPQKGATLQQVELLDQGLGHLAQLFRAQLGKDVETKPGSGAAGGLGAGLVAMLGATLTAGAKLVLEATGFARRVADCDLCLTGEGRLDGQSLSGKACIEVAHAAQKHGVKTIALAGVLGPDADRALKAGLHACYAISEGLTIEESIRRAEELLERKTGEVVRKLGLSSGQANG